MLPLGVPSSRQLLHRQRGHVRRLQGPRRHAVPAADRPSRDLRYHPLASSRTAPGHVVVLALSARFGALTARIRAASSDVQVGHRHRRRASAVHARPPVPATMGDDSHHRPRLRAGPGRRLRPHLDRDAPPCPLTMPASPRRRQQHGTRRRVPSRGCTTRSPPDHRGQLPAPRRAVGRIPQCADHRGHRLCRGRPAGRRHHPKSPSQARAAHRTGTPGATRHSLRSRRPPAARQPGPLRGRPERPGPCGTGVAWRRPGSDAGHGRHAGPAWDAGGGWAAAGALLGAGPFAAYIASRRSGAGRPP